MNLKTNVKGLKTNMKSLETNVKGLETNVKGLETTILQKFEILSMKVETQLAGFTEA
jgi:hypothetical protein